MRVGLFADVHSNLEALEAVLRHMRGQRLDRLLCLGDVVGYNANPAECLQRVRELACPVLKGNHDEAATWREDPSNFNKLALESIRYSRQALSEEEIAYLNGLPYQLEVEGFTVVHANLERPEQWGYLLNPLDAVGSMQRQRTAVAFFAHTHVPHLFMDDGVHIREYFFQRCELRAGSRYLINVGSVGQPRDGDWRAAYAIYDTGERAVELHRVEYDVATTQAKVLRAGLPVRLAERLIRAS